MHSRPTPSRRRDCHFADIPSQSLLNAYQRKRGVQQNDSLADGYPRQPRGPEVPNRCRRPGRWLKYEWQNMNGRNRREQEGTGGNRRPKRTRKTDRTTCVGVGRLLQSCRWLGLRTGPACQPYGGAAAVRRREILEEH